MGNEPATDHEGGEILVMDDEVFIREYAGDILCDAGFHVQFAKDGTEALEIFKRTRDLGEFIDIIILDLTVRGGMGGEETIKNLLKIDPEVKAIVSSGYSNNPVLANYRKHGFRGVISKPFSPKEMCEIVVKTIQGAV